MAAQDLGKDDEREIRDSFVKILQSDKPITIPDETLYGAITHFLSTSPLPDLPALVSALVESPICANSREISQGVQHAARNAISAKIDSLNAALTKAYFSDYRLGRQARQWLEVVGEPAISAESGRGRMAVLSGLLEGIRDAQDVPWGKMKDRLEEELVVEAASYEMSSEDSLEAVYGAIILTSDDTLAVLDIEVSLVRVVDPKIIANKKGILADLIGRHLFLMSKKDTADEAARCAASVERLVKLLNDREPSSRRELWAIMRSLSEESSIMLQRDELPGEFRMLIRLN
jgi:hypothetical protein